MSRSLAALGLLVLCAGAVAAANAARNPGFESGLVSWIDASGSPSFLSTTPRTGRYAAGKKVTSVSAEYWSQVYQDVTLAPGQPLYARLYARSSFRPEASARGGLLVQFLDAGNRVVGEARGTRSVGGNMGWRLIEASSSSAPSGTVKARVGGYLWAARRDTVSLNNGSVLFDDVFVDRIRRAPALPTALVNPGFENGLNDWTDAYGSPSWLSRSGVQQGTFSAAKTVDTVAYRDFWSQLHQDVACAPQRRITISAFARSTASASSLLQAGVMAEIYSASGTKLGEFTGEKIGVQAAWKKLTLTIPSTPAGAARIRIICFLWAPRGNTASRGASAFFDGVSCTSESASALPPIVAGQSLVLLADSSPMNVTWGTDINMHQAPYSPNEIGFTNATAGEGSQSFRIKVNTNNLNVNFLRYPLVTYLDLTPYAAGRLNLMVKASRGLSIGIHIAENYDIMVHLVDGQYGFRADNTWCSVSIPMSEFTTRDLDLSRLYGWVKFYAGYYEGIQGGEEYFIDRVFFAK